MESVALVSCVKKTLLRQSSFGVQIFLVINFTAHCLMFPWIIQNFVKMRLFGKELAAASPTIQKIKVTAVLYMLMENDVLEPRSIVIILQVQIILSHTPLMATH